MTEAFANHLLDLAQRGETEAQRRVCLRTWEMFGFRTRNFYSRDVAVDKEDLKQSFWEGTIRGIQKDKGIGDRWYFLGQMGWWSVGKAVRDASRAAATSLPTLYVAGRVSDEGTEANPDPWEAIDEREDTERMTIERNYAEGFVRVLATKVPAGNVRKAMEAILSGAVGSPEDPGFNKRLAAYMKVSPQRASQVMAQLRGIVTADAQMADLAADRRV